MYVNATEVLARTRACDKAPYSDNIPGRRKIAEQTRTSNVPEDTTDSDTKFSSIE